MFHLPHYSHHPVHCFSEGSEMITWWCYYPSSNFHKHVWLTADCPHGRLDLKQENNEQNITVPGLWLEKTSLGRTSAARYILYSYPQHALASWVNGTLSIDLYSSWERKSSPHLTASVTLVSINISHPFNLCVNAELELHLMIVYIIN